jgi:hypothetical protein
MPRWIDFWNRAKSMAARLVLNELSLNLQSRSESVEQIMRRFISVVRKAFSLGAERALLVPCDFLAIELAPGTTLRNYLNFFKSETDQLRRRENEDLSSWLKDILTTLTFSNEVADCDYLYEATEAIGLGRAFLTGSLAISFAGRQWTSPFLELEERCLNHDASEIVTSRVTVRNSVTDEHVLVHQQWLLECTQNVQFSEATLRISIQNFAKGDLRDFTFGSEFISSAKACGFVGETGAKHLLCESCARILLGNPKNQERPFTCAPLGENWGAFRSHLTKSGPAFRLMYWVHSSGHVVFANIGPKQELRISYEIDPGMRTAFERRGWL